jgi:hypothetical protein
MFTRVTIDGSTSFVASESCPIDLDGESFDEEAVDEQEDQLTPLSIGTKRASSTSTTASSPSKRSKSPVVRSMDNNMREHNEIAMQKICLMESMFQQRKQDIKDARSALSKKVELVTQMAKEMGITATTLALFMGCTRSSTMTFLWTSTLPMALMKGCSSSRKLPRSTTRPSYVISYIN